MDKKSYGPLFIIFAAILWSLDGLLRRSLYVLSPIVVVFYEHFIGFIILLPILLPHLRTILNIKPKIWGAFAWVTLLSSILGTVFYTAALGKINFIQFSVVVLLQQLQPLFVVFFAWLILKEPITKGFFYYLTTALLGAYMVSFPDLHVHWNTGQGTIVAALLAVAAAFSWGSSTAFSRYFLLELPTIVATGLRFGLASFLGLIFVVGLGQVGQVLTISRTQLLTLLTIALSTGMVALFIYYYGLKRTQARISAICELAWPVSAVFIDLVVFRKPLTSTQLLGAAILILTIYRISIVNKKNFHGKKTH